MHCFSLYRLRFPIMPSWKVLNHRIQLIILLIVLQPCSAHAANLLIEVNKTEQRANACRVYLYMNNLTSESIEALVLDMVSFNKDGIIEKNMAVNIAPLPVDKRSVKAFDLKDVRCDEIGSLLINKVLRCEMNSIDSSNCLSILSVSSKTSIPLNK